MWTMLGAGGSLQILSRVLISWVRREEEGRGRMEALVSILEGGRGRMEVMM
jgi:hypothetical protein